MGGELGRGVLKRRGGDGSTEEEGRGGKQRGWEY